MILESLYAGKMADYTIQEFETAHKKFRKMAKELVRMKSKFLRCVMRKKGIRDVRLETREYSDRPHIVRITLRGGREITFTPAKSFYVEDNLRHHSPAIAKLEDEMTALGKKFHLV